MSIIWGIHVSIWVNWVAYVVEIVVGRQDLKVTKLLQKVSVVRLLLSACPSWLGYHLASDRRISSWLSYRDHQPSQDDITDPLSLSTTASQRPSHTTHISMFILHFTLPWCWSTVSWANLFVYSWKWRRPMEKAVLPWILQILSPNIPCWFRHPFCHLILSEIRAALNNVRFDKNRGCATNWMWFPIELHLIWNWDKAQTGGCTTNRRWAYLWRNTLYYTSNKLFCTQKIWNVWGS